MNGNWQSYITDPLVRANLHKNWRWFLGLGIALAALGTLALIFSFTSTVLSVLYLGALLFVGGIVEVVKAFKLKNWGPFILHIFLGVLYCVGGFFIMMHPALNAITLTLLLAIFFVVSGIMKIIFALTHSALPHKNWLLLNGALTLLLGILIWMQWPYSGLWVLGAFVGIDMIATGWTWIMLALQFKEIRI